MKTLYNSFFTGCLCLFLGCTNGEDIGNPKAPTEALATWEVDCSIRALEVVDSEIVWYGGSRGRFGWTVNGGESWRHDSLKLVDGSAPAFRSIAVTPEAIHLLTIGSPAVLFRSTDQGMSWDSVYTEHHTDAFYDSMVFWDANDGIAMGDPTDGCLSVICTRDGGATWHKIPCTALPPARAGEAAFAASNGNIAVEGNTAWMVSGGAASRVYVSADRGRTWDVRETPVVQGGTMTGMFSISMADAKNGVAWGGDWEAMDDNKANKLATTDGGDTWELLTPDNGPGYRSCVRHVPGTSGHGIWAVGIPGISQSMDRGMTWSHESDSTFLTVRFTPDGQTGWLAGRGHIQRRPVTLP